MSKYNREQAREILVDFLTKLDLLEKFKEDKIKVKKYFYSRLNYKFDKTKEDMVDDVVGDMSIPQKYDNNIMTSFFPDDYITTWLKVEKDWLKLWE